MTTRQAMGLRLGAALAAAMTATAASAQASADPIGAILSQTAPVQSQTSPPAPAAAAPAPAPAQPPASGAPVAPPPSVPAAEAAPAPVPPTTVSPAPYSPAPAATSGVPPIWPAPATAAVTTASPSAQPGIGFQATTPRPYSPLPPQQVFRRPPITEPVHIEEVGRTPERTFAATDVIYEARLRSSFASAQGLQGPLDGSWTLSAAGGGEDLYGLQLVDQGGGVLEGAWRDLHRAGALGASGFVDDIRRSGSTLTLRFFPDNGGATASATLTAGLDGRWSGELTDRGKRRDVVLRRN